MLSLWSECREAEIEAYASTLILPPHLAHLRLAPLSFARQTPCATGREPLLLTYVGAGRLEEHGLDPGEHVLPLLNYFHPALVAERIQIPRDDAAWFWPADGGPLRIYFSPTAAALGLCPDHPQAEDAYVSVSRQHVFLGRSVLENYVRARLEHLGLDASALELHWPQEGGIALAAGRVGGQLLCEDPVAAEDLVHFAGLRRVLDELRETVRLDLGEAAVSQCAARGICLPLKVCV